MDTGMQNVQHTHTQYAEDHFVCYFISRHTHAHIRVVWEFSNRITCSLLTVTWIPEQSILCMEQDENWMVTLVRQDHKLILICILLDFWIVIAGLSIVKCPLIISFPRFAASSLAWKESQAFARYNEGYIWRCEMDSLNMH